MVVLKEVMAKGINIKEVKVMLVVIWVEVTVEEEMTAKGVNI